MQNILKMKQVVQKNSHQLKETPGWSTDLRRREVTNPVSKIHSTQSVSLVSREFAEGMGLKDFSLDTSPYVMTPKKGWEIVE